MSTRLVKNQIGDSQLTIESLRCYKPLEIERAFIAELHARWLARHQPVAGTAPVSTGPDPRGTVFFISYSRSTDLPAAEQLFQSLQEQGATENEI